MSVVPVIDLSPLFIDYESDKARLDAELALAKRIGSYCEKMGFLVFTGHHVDVNLIDETWKLVQEFFDLPLDEKNKYCLPQEVNPFGYSPLGGEILSTGKAVETDQAVSVAHPDLKEMFTIGPDDPRTGFPPRVLPGRPDRFAEVVTKYYDALVALANRILRLFALALNLEDPNYFSGFVDKHASALRCINYPEIPDNKTVLPGQCRASAHTDYGTITILRADAPGLQVRKDNIVDEWHDVPVMPNCFIVNLGDLMRRWTNDRWVSTLHRVVVTEGEDTSCRRQSIAFFHNVNRDAEISVLAQGEEPKYPPIIAGEFLMQKHLASVKH